MTPAGIKPRSAAGFTLLEIIIAVTILAFLTIFTAQAIQTALKNRAKIQGELDRLGSLRAALRVMGNDVQKAFNYRDINIALYNEAAKERNRKIREAQGQSGNPPPGGNPPPNSPPPSGNPPSGQPGENPYAKMQELKPKVELVLTHFLGAKDRLDFTTLSYARTTADQRFSDQAEVSYFLKDCRRRRDRDRATRCLMRRVSPILDKNLEEGGTTSALLEDVQELKLRYLGPGSENEWLSDWFSNERGDDRTRGKFPYAVEITLEVRNAELKDEKPLRMTVVAPIRNPNNDPFVPADASQVAPGGPGVPGAPGAPGAPGGPGG